MLLLYRTITLNVIRVLCEAYPAPDLTINYVADEAPAMLDIEIAAQRSMLENAYPTIGAIPKSAQIQCCRSASQTLSSPSFNSGQAPELTRIVGNFDDTWFD